jgi:hypothetical protein
MRVNNLTRVLTQFVAGEAVDARIKECPKSDLLVVQNFSAHKPISTGVRK